jgi:hypothetical protein
MVPSDSYINDHYATVDVAMVSLCFNFPPPQPAVFSSSRKSSRIDLSTLHPSVSGDFDGESVESLRSTFSTLPFEIHQAIAVSCGPKWAALLAQANRNMRNVVQDAKINGSLAPPSVTTLEVLEWCSGNSSRLRIAWEQGFPHDRIFEEAAAAVGDVKVTK